jgi:hypothetical protein
VLDVLGNSGKGLLFGLLSVSLDIRDEDFVGGIGLAQSVDLVVCSGSFCSNFAGVSRVLIFAGEGLEESNNGSPSLLLLAAS